MARYVIAQGTYYRAEQYRGGLSGVIVRNADNVDVCFMQDEEWTTFADECETIPENVDADLLLDAYDTGDQ